MSFDLTDPITITSGIMTTNATEPTAAWTTGTYSLGQKATKAGRVWESLQNSNTNQDPEATTGWWLDLGPTNPLAMFDDQIGTQTTRADSLTIGLDLPTRCDTLGLFNVDASSVNVTAWWGDEERTNLLRWSEDFDNAVWTKSNATISTNIADAPDGSTTADALIEDTAPSSTHYTRQNTSWTSGTTYTNSIFAKERPGSAKRYLRLLFPGGGGVGFAVNYSAVFDLAAGTFITANGPVAAGMVDQGNGWWRCWVSAEANATITSNVHVRLTNTYAPGLSTYNGDGVSGLYVWGSQLEVGSEPTQYIPTSGAPVTVTGERVYNRDFSMVSYLGIANYWDHHFLPVTRRRTLYVADLPIVTGLRLTVTFLNAGSNAACGHMVVGRRRSLGQTLIGATLDYIDFSKFEPNEFGIRAVVVRSQKDQGSFEIWVEGKYLDLVRRIVKSYSGRPILISASSKFESTNYFGLLTKGSTLINYTDFAVFKVNVEEF